MQVPDESTQQNRIQDEAKILILIIGLTPCTCRCSARNPSSQQPMTFPLCNVTYQQKTVQRIFDFSKKFRKWPFCFTRIPWDQTGQKCIKTELSHIWGGKRPSQFLWLSQADKSFTKCIRALNWHCTVNLPYFFCPVNRNQGSQGFFLSFCSTVLSTLLIHHTMQSTPGKIEAPVCPSHKRRGHTSSQREAYVQVSQNMCHAQGMGHNTDSQLNRR